MLFHKFQKVPPIFFKCPRISVSGGKKLPPKKYVNFLPWYTVVIYDIQVQCAMHIKNNKHQIVLTPREKEGG